MIRTRQADSFAVIEPRILNLKSEIERLLSLVELEKDGEPVAVDGFRLRDLSRWRSCNTNTAMNSLTPISGLCNSRCSFCFEENIPYAREQSLMSVAEAATRLKYYSPEDGKCLFPSNRPHMETFVHPQAVEIIELARRRQPDKLFWITTNGSHFDEPTVARLAQLKPLIFKLSVNVSDPEENRRLMKTGARTEVALGAPALLQKYRIPFMGSLVAWPTTSLEHIVETVRFLERHEAYAVRIRLPLTHRWLKSQIDHDFRGHWESVSRLAHQLRHECRVPLFVEPPVYWVNPVIPEVDGVVLNSPADKVGVRPGDVVESINGVAVHTRIESEARLDQCHLAREERIELNVCRDGQTLSFTLTEPAAGTDTYPYNSDYFYRGENYGIFHVEDFRLGHIQKLLDLIEEHRAQNVLLFSSRIVAPIFEILVNGIPEFKERLARFNIFIETVDRKSVV